MNTIYDFSRKINELTTAKQYSESLIYFKKNKIAFSQQEIGANMYLISDILNCLRHEKEFGAAFKFMERYEVKMDETTSERVLTATAWLLYDKFKAENDTSELEQNDHWHENNEMENQPEIIAGNKSELTQRIEQMVFLLQEKESVYCRNVLEFLFKIVVKAEIKRAKPDWHFVLVFCESVDPQKLSTQCKTIQVTLKGQTKDMELASTCEEWYAHTSKALFMTNQNLRCLEFSKTALETIEKFHYSNDLWLARRMALCLKKMGNTQEAILSLEKLLKKRRDWFILKELSEFYLETGDAQKALRYAKEAMNGYGPLTFKVELIEMLGDMLSKKGESEIGYKHYLLAKLLREQEKWKIDKMLQNKIDVFVRANNCVPSERRKLEAELKTFWKPMTSLQPQSDNNRNYNHQTVIAGTVSRLLVAKEAGMDGFVKHNNGGSAYFFVPRDNKIFDKLCIGLSLEYEVVAAQNGKGDKAIKIKIV